MADIRMSTLPLRTSAAGVTLLGYTQGGVPVGLDPSATHPTLAEIGAPDADAVTLALQGKQDVAARGAANGYAALDGTGKVPAAQLPATGGGGVSLSDAAPLPDAAAASPGTLGEAARADHQHPRPTPAEIGAALASHTHAIGAVTGLQVALDAKEAASAKGQINGYAPLGSDGKVPSQHLPAGISQAALDAKADAAATTAALALKADITAMNTALAAKAGINDSRIVNAVQPGYLTPIEGFTAAFSVVQGDANKIKRCTSATGVIVTLPSLSIGTTVRFIQGAAGTITFAPGASQTINSFGGLLTTAGAHANVIATMIAANTWNLSGNLA